MKIELGNFGSDAVTTTSESNNTKMRFADNAMPIIFDMFTEKLYSNPIGSMIREITSNAFDSHVEAKVNKPVVIKKTHDVTTDTYYLSIIDFGVGMSPQRINNVYTVYLESTKRDDNSQIGGWGLGGKTPLAYRRYIGNSDDYDNSFHVITIFDGVKYHYVVHEGAESPEVTLLFKEKTTQSNGTEIKIQILEKDLNKVFNELRNQLYYFENLIFEGFSESNNDRLNNYKIYKAKHFWYRGSGIYSEMHISLGRVAYPIDYNVLELDSWNFKTPIALKFDVGELEVTPSRENLKYTEKVIKAIKDKIELVKAELGELLVKQNEKIVSLIDYYNHPNHTYQLFFNENNSINLVRGLETKNDKVLPNFKYKDVYVQTKEGLFDTFFDVKIYGKDRSRFDRYDQTNILNHLNLKDKKNLYFVNGEFKRVVKKQRYLNSIHDRFYIITPKKLDDLFFNLKKNTFRRTNSGELDLTAEQKKQVVGMFNEILNIVQKDVTHYDDLEIPEDFVPTNTVQSKELDNVIINAYVGNSRRTRVDLKELIKFNGITFYGFQEDEGKLGAAINLVNILFNSNIVDSYSKYNNPKFYKWNSGTNQLNRILVMRIAKTNERYMQHLKKAYHIDLFYEKLLKRKKDVIDNTFKTKDIFNKYNEINNFYFTKDMEKINKPFHDKMAKIVNGYKDIKDMQNSSLLNSVYDVKRFYTPDVKQVAIPMEKEIDEVLEIQKKNDRYLNYLSLYRYSLLDVEIDIIKKLFVFK